MTDEAEQDDGWEWARVEIFGHRVHCGRTREEQRFGAKKLPIDVPPKGDPPAHGWETVYYGGSSIFSFALISEAAALKANKPYEAAARLGWTDPDDVEEDGSI